MKVTFIFSDTAAPDTLRDHSIKTSFELPDIVADCQDDVLKMGELVGKVTHAVLHITCKEAGLREFPIESAGSGGVHITSSFRDTLLRFQCWQGYGFAYRVIKIIAPVTSPFTFSVPTTQQKRRSALEYHLLNPQTVHVNNDVQRDYLALINELADHTLALLNTDPAVDNVHLWTLSGFHPYWKDKAAITKANKKVSREIAASRREAKHAQKAPQIASTQPSTITPLIHGAGRRPGAIPGVFKGVQMRSQLEIRFAAELEKRDIRWLYEVERLGEEQYLVDFYLPDLKIWVEVKGTFEPRDEFQLPEVAAYLRLERNEKLFVYTQHKVFAVSAKTFISMNRQEFWSKLN